MAADWGRIQISARIVQWPCVCPCCGGQPDTQLGLFHTRTWGKRVVHQETKEWSIPYCAQCVRHAAARTTAINAMTLAITVPLLSLAALLLIRSQTILVISLLASAVFLVCFVPLWLWKASVAEEALTKHCCSKGHAARFLGWNGTVQTFEFGSPDYREAFRAANPGKCLD